MSVGSDALVVYFRGVSMIDFPQSDLLSRCAEQYLLARNLAANSAYQFRHSIDLFGRFLGQQATLADLEPHTVSHWLAHLEADHSPRSVAGHRTNIMAFWRWLAERGDVQAPRQVRRVRKPDPCPVAWTLDELRQLLRAAETFQHQMPDGSSSSVYFSALVRTAYESGLRRSDLFLLRHEQIRHGGAIQMVQHKTGHTHQPRLTSKTMDLIAQIARNPPLAWPSTNGRHFYTVWKRLVRVAGIRKGALQQIRRSGATHLYKDHPEDVQRYLGHRTPTMQRHYVDLSLAAPQQNLPPEL